MLCQYAHRYGTSGIGVDIYDLIKYTRSKQNTNINQRPIVKVGDWIANKVRGQAPMA